MASASVNTARDRKVGSPARAGLQIPHRAVASDAGGAEPSGPHSCRQRGSVRAGRAENPRVPRRERHGLPLREPPQRSADGHRVHVPGRVRRFGLPGGAFAHRQGAARLHRHVHPRRRDRGRHQGRPPGAGQARNGDRARVRGAARGAVEGGAASPDRTRRRAAGHRITHQRTGRPRDGSASTIRGAATTSPICSASTSPT